MRQRNRTFTKPKSVERMAAILALLSDRKLRTSTEIAKCIGLSKRRTREYVRKLRDDKKVRIGGYVDNVNPRYTLGKMPDAKRKPPKSNAEYCHAYYLRRKPDPEFMIDQKNRSAIYRLNKRQKPIVDIYATIFRRAA